jgi:hypothetical protein
LEGISLREQNLKVRRHVHVPVTVVIMWMYFVSGRDGPGPGDYDPSSGAPNVCSVYYPYCTCALQMYTLLIIRFRILSRYQRAKELRPILAM